MTDKLTDSQQAVADFTDDNAFDLQPLGPPSPFHNFGQGWGDATMQGFARTGRAGAMAGAGVVGIAQSGYNVGRRIAGKPETTAATDWVFENVIDDVMTPAVDFWTPDAQDLGKAGQTLNSLTTGLVPLLVGGGNPVPLLATTALDQPLDLVNQGVDAGTALKVGTVNTVATAVGFKLPFLGNNLFTRVGTGVGGNLAVGEGSRQASAALLDDAGHAALAEGYRDPTAAWMDVGFGVVFGGLAHAASPNAPKITPAQRDAFLTARNAWHFQDASAPGAPVDGVSFVGHQTAMTEAMQQFMVGEPVNVTIPEGGLQFNPRERALLVSADEAAREVPGSPQAIAAGNYDAMLVALESGGKANAKAPTSSATGLHQFTSPTWMATVRKAKPAWAEGLTDAQLLALRTDPAKSAEMEQVLRAENAAALAGAGQAATPFNLYAAHHFGSGKGVAFAKAADDTPMSAILSPGQLNANAYLKGLTKAEAIDNWTQRARKAGVEVDDAPMLADALPPIDDVPPMRAESLLPDMPAARVADDVDGHVARSLAQLDEGGVLLNPRDDYRIARVGDDYTVTSLKDGGPAKQTMDRAGVQTFLTERAQPAKQTRAAVSLMPVPPPKAAEVPHARVALDRLVAETPDSLHVTSYDADGAPRYQSLTEAKAEIDTEHAQAVREADAYEAAVNCFIRHGEAA